MEHNLLPGDLVILRITEVPRRYGLVVENLTSGLLRVLFSDMLLERHSPNILKKL
jgi:hypothetical protein